QVGADGAGVARGFARCARTAPHGDRAVPRPDPDGGDGSSARVANDHGYIRAPGRVPVHLSPARPRGLRHGGPCPCRRRLDLQHGGAENPPNARVRLNRRTARGYTGATPMKFGTFHLFQKPPGWGDEDVFRAELEQIEKAEQLGFDAVWLAEHHFQWYGIATDLMVIAGWVAARTQRVRIGTAIVVLPFHNPVRLAEQAS